MEILRAKRPLQAILWGHNAAQEGAEARQETAQGGAVKREDDGEHGGESEGEIRPFLDGAQGECSAESKSLGGAVRAATAQYAAGGEPAEEQSQREPQKVPTAIASSAAPQQPAAEPDRAPAPKTAKHTPDGKRP